MRKKNSDEYATSAYGIQIMLRQLREHSTFSGDPHADAKRAEKHNVGNCYEMAACGLKFAAEEHPGQKVELFQIDTEDRYFLVIGRNSGSAPSDYLNWGPNCVLCDPWMQSCYPASEIEKYLKIYAGPLTVEGRTFSKVRTFDPASQHLKLVL